MKGYWSCRAAARHTNKVEEERPATAAATAAAATATATAAAAVAAAGLVVGHVGGEPLWVSSGGHCTQQHDSTGLWHNCQCPQGGTACGADAAEGAGRQMTHEGGRG